MIQDFENGGCPKRTLFGRRGADSLTFSNWTSRVPGVRATGRLPIRLVYG